MEILVILLVVLILARSCAEFALRCGQPAVVGEILGGILLGLLYRPAAGYIDVLAALPDNEVFVALADLGVFFLMILAGIELSPRQLARASKGSLAVAAGGMLVPFALGALLGWAFLPDSAARGAQILFLATTLAITAVPVAVKVLMELDALDSTIGHTVVAAAVIDDVFSLVLLAFLTAVIQQGGAPAPGHYLVLVMNIGLFLALTYGIWFLLGPWFGRALRRLRLEQEDFTGLVVLALGYAILAELLHLHFVIGAFAAGLLFTRRVAGEALFADVKRKLEGTTTGFLAPIFFVSIGVRFDLSALCAIPGFVILLIIAAFFGKVLGAAAGAIASGLAPRTALNIGIAMSARGVVALIIADIALRAGLFDTPSDPIVDNLFAAVVMMAILTTLLVPMLLRYTMPDSRSPAG